jgi:hypothetical protein
MRIIVKSVSRLPFTVLQLLLPACLIACTQQGTTGGGPDPLSQLMNGIKQSIAQPGAGFGLPAPRSNPSLEQVGLKNIMPEYDDTKPLSQQFPHVAITVLRSPTNWAGTEMQANPIGGGFSPIRGCWTMTAVVWSNMRSSKTVGPFDWCSPDDIQIHMGPMGGMGILGAMDDSTGAERTNGPNPPETLFPEDRHDFKNGFVPTIKLSEFTGSALWLMFGNVIYGMGSMPGKSGDYRIWIVTIDG